MRREWAVFLEHLFQIRAAKDAPTVHFQTNIMLRNVHSATDVSVNKMRS